MFDVNTRILIIDDMSTMRQLVETTLRGYGYSQFEKAVDGVAAWDLLDKANPPFGLVVSDWNMPNMTGLDLLKKVRADKRFTSLPFVLLTAESEADQVMDAIVAGVSNYCVKPFTPATFKQKLEQAYARHNQKK